MRFYAFCLLVLIGCTPNVKTKLQTDKAAPLPDTERVYVLQVNDHLPDSSEPIGDFKVGGAGLSTNCTYEVALEAAQAQARAEGANILYISQIEVPPGFGTMCYRLRGRARIFCTFHRSRCPPVSERCVTGFGERCVRVELKPPGDHPLGVPRSFEVDVGSSRSRTIWFRPLCSSPLIGTYQCLRSGGNIPARSVVPAL